MRKHDEFQPLFDSRAKDVTAKAAIETSIATIKMTEAIEELPDKLADKFFEKMTQLMPPEPVPPQITVTNPPQNPPVLPPPQEVSEVGQLVAQNQPITQPLEAFNLEGFLAQLDAPGGGVRWRDRLYVQRAADAQLKRQLLKWGSTTTIHAPQKQ